MTRRWDVSSVGCLASLASSACGGAADQDGAADTGVLDDGDGGDVPGDSTGAPNPGTNHGTDTDTAGDAATDDDSPPTCAADGFHVEGGTLYDSHCNEFILRGINYPYAWFSWRDDTAQQFADIASMGANAVRVVLANGEQWTRVSGEEVAQVIDHAMANELVAVLEVHDATGWSEQAPAAHPQTAVDYWLSDDIRDAIDGHEARVIVNVANEPMGNTTTDEWAPFHTDAVAQLRAAGLQHTLMIDAPNWGQDWTNTMRDGDDARDIFAADPDGNVVFSVHMYDVYGTASIVETYLTQFLAEGLPLVVGEFAADHGPGAEVAEDAIMSLCEQMGVGYIGWSWSGNSAELSSLDIAIDFSANNLSAWGQALVDGPNGLSATGQTCTCYD